MTDDATYIVRKLDALTAIITAGGGGLSNKVPYTGATTSVDLNSQTLVTTGKIATGTTISVSSLIQFTSMRGTGRVDLGEYTAGRGAIWINQPTPSVTNYSIAADISGNTFVNSNSQVCIQFNGGIQATFGNLIATFASGLASYDFSFASTNGTKLGTSASQKVSLYGVTPDVQPTTAIVGGTFVSNTSGLIDGSATYGGYTGTQIVAALKRIGALA